MYGKSQINMRSHCFHYRCIISTLGNISIVENRWWKQCSSKGDRQHCISKNQWLTEMECIMRNDEVDFGRELIKLG